MPTNSKKPFRMGDGECYHVNDQEATEKGDDSKFILWLNAQGIKKNPYEFTGGLNPFIYVNLTHHVYCHGVYGAKFCQTTNDILYTPEEFMHFYESR